MLCPRRVAAGGASGSSTTRALSLSPCYSLLASINPQSGRVAWQQPKEVDLSPNSLSSRFAEPKLLAVNSIRRQLISQRNRN